MKAKLAGWCAECGEKYSVGADVVQRDKGKHAHAECVTVGMSWRNRDAIEHSSIDKPERQGRARLTGDEPQWWQDMLDEIEENTQAMLETRKRR